MAEKEKTAREIINFFEANPDARETFFATDVERLARIENEPIKYMTAGLSEVDKVTDCIVDYRDWLWLIGQAKETEKMKKEKSKSN